MCSERLDGILREVVETHVPAGWSHYVIDGGEHYVVLGPESSPLEAPDAPIVCVELTGEIRFGYGDPEGEFLEGDEKTWPHNNPLHA